MHEITDETLVSFLSRTPLFNCLSPVELAACTSAFELLEVPKGSCIFEEGDAGESWYLLLDGEVEIAKATPVGPHHVLGELETGDCFGEMALIDRTTRMAAAHATAPSVLAVLSQERFRALLEDHPTVASRLLWAMARVMSRRLRGLTGVLIDLIDSNDFGALPKDSTFYSAVRNNITWN
jgi:CRP/FNR family cyclic AMP-dependent transcriptional regulator